MVDGCCVLRKGKWAVLFPYYALFFFAHAVFFVWIFLSAPIPYSLSGLIFFFLLRCFLSLESFQIPYLWVKCLSLDPRALSTLSITDVIPSVLFNVYFKIILCSLTATKNNTQKSPVSFAQVSAMSNCSPYRLEHWLDMVQDTHFHHHNYPPGCLFIAMITYLQLSPPPNIWQPFNCYPSSISINVPFQKCHMSGMTKYVILWVWSFSLRVTLLRFIHIVSWINDSCVTEWFSWWKDIKVFIRSYVEVYLCCLWLMWNSSAGEGNKSQKTFNEQMTLMCSMSSPLSPVPQSPDWALRTRGLGKRQHSRLESKLVKTFSEDFNCIMTWPLAYIKFKNDFTISTNNYCIY